MIEIFQNFLLQDEYGTGQNAPIYLVISLQESKRSSIQIKSTKFGSLNFGLSLPAKISYFRPIYDAFLPDSKNIKRFERIKKKRFERINELNGYNETEIETVDFKTLHEFSESNFNKYYPNRSLDSLNSCADTSN